MHKILNKTKIILENDLTKYYFIILMISFFVCTPLLIGFSNGQDMIYHISKAVGTESALKSGQIFPLIAPNFVKGFGYSWNIFYPPFSNYAIMIIKFITKSYVKALNIFIFMTVILSGIFMFQLMNKISKSGKIAMLAAILYIVAPYHLVDIYIRGALGEIIAFMFIPLVFLGLYNIVEENSNKHYLLGIGAIGLVLSHNISTLLTIIICIIYLAINIKKVMQKQKIKKLLINIMFVIGISMFFFVPLIQNKNNTNYAVFNELRGSAAGLHENSVYSYQLLFGKMQYQWSYSLNEENAQNLDMCFALGLIIIIPIIFTPFVYKKVKQKRIYLTALIVGIMSLILTTTIVPWDKLPNILCFIQYSFRFLLIATFTLVPIAAINIAYLTENFDYKSIMVITIIAIIYITPLMQEAQIVKNIDWKKFYEVENIELNEKYSEYCATFEYLPSKAFNNKNYIANRSNDPEIIEGNCNIMYITKDGLNIEFDVKNVADNTTIELPYIYYLGYNAEINGKKIKTTESKNGFVQITLKNGEEGKINVKYTGTLAYKISMTISIISFIIFIIYINIYIRKMKK